jgi:tetratricopeptide (TPR) repeat protein
MNPLPNEPFRKRRPTGKPPKSQFSVKLAGVQEAYQSGEVESALAALDELSTGHADDPKTLSRIVSTVADAGRDQGSFDDAVEHYRRSLEILDEGEDVRLWLRPAIGEISSLLKAVRVEEAVQRAGEIWQQAQEYYQRVEAEHATTTAQLQQAGRIRVKARPVRPSVFATKMGNAFFEEGYLDAARQLYLQAVLITPNGASRARQGLARIAMADDDPAIAERYARESLLVGKFQNKTIPSWELLVVARKKQEKPLLDEELYQSFLITTKTGVKARGLLTIVKCLRGYGDPRWQEIARSWMESESDEDEVIAVEMAKLLIAEEKILSADPRLVAASAHRILRSELVSPQEMIAAAKAVVSGILRGGGTPQIDALAAKVERRFGPEKTFEARHAMALGAMLGGNHDLARQILATNFTVATAGSDSWGRTLWAWARMEKVLKRFDAAAALYLDVARHPATPARFRIQALLTALRIVTEHEGATNPDALIVEVAKVVSTIDDYATLLDAGRQLSLAGNKLASLKKIVATRGYDAAYLAFAEAAEPTSAMAILNFVARRQFYDLGAQSELIRFWNEFPYEKREALWSKSTDYWEYQSLLFRAYIAEGRIAEAEALVSEAIDDGSAPPNGLLHIGTAVANWHMTTGKIVDAMVHFDWLTKEQPTHRLAAFGHYWLGLLAYHRKAIPMAQNRFEALRRCFSVTPTLYWEWELDSRAAIMLNRMGTAIIDVTQFTEEYLARQERLLDSDLHCLSESRLPI